MFRIRIHVNTLFDLLAPKPERLGRVKLETEPDSFGDAFRDPLTEDGIGETRKRQYRDRLDRIERENEYRHVS